MNFPRSFLRRREELSWVEGGGGAQRRAVAESSPRTCALTDTCENATIEPVTLYAVLKINFKIIQKDYLYGIYYK